jgi:hypothetical protein
MCRTPRAGSGSCCGRCPRPLRRARSWSPVAQGRSLFQPTPHPPPHPNTPSPLTPPLPPYPPTPPACPPGYRYRDESASPCGLGFWKAGVDFAVACSACGAGLTTATTTSGSAADCALAKAGYRLDKTGGVVTGAAACGVGL